MERKEPLLVLMESVRISGQEEYYIYNVLENRWDAARIPILFDRNPLPCNYGWVILLNSLTHDCSLWNPKSREMIQLPELRLSSIYSQCVLSKPPTEPGFHILFKSANKCELAFCQIGDDEFVEMSIEDNEDVQRVETLKFFHGNIYALVGFRTRLMTISFVDKTIEFVPVLDISPSLLQLRPWSSYVHYYLIDDDYDDDDDDDDDDEDDDDDDDDDGMLLVCQMFPDYYLSQFCDFYIFRIHINGLECVELLDIGRRTLFLSHTGNTFYRSSTGIKPNSIYFTSTERSVCVFNLDNRSTTSLLPCFAAHRLRHDTYWIEDSFS